MRPEIVVGAGICAVLVMIMLARGSWMREAPEGLERAEVDVNGFYITLTSGCSRLFIAVTPWQLEPIEQALHGATGQRPGTHDVLVDAVAGLGGNVTMAVVSSEEQGTYYARLIITGGRRVVDLDAIPSDAIAVAVLAGAPVYVSRDVLKNAADICAGKAA